MYRLQGQGAARHRPAEGHGAQGDLTVTTPPGVRRRSRTRGRGDARLWRGTDS